ncbi:hypothetical protein GGI05_006157, partial [Coemansia sp. RSA 2603]
KRKIKCSGTRPVCDHCLRRSIACIYKPLARTRRTPSLAGSPATHGYSQPHAAEMFYDPSGNLAPQPMAIPGLSPAYHPTPSSLSPGLRYASAPAPNVDSTGFAQMFHETLSQQQQQQGNMLRPANAIPPYLLAAGAPVQSPDCSPFAFAQGILYDVQPGQQQMEPRLGAFASPKTASFFNQDGSLSLLPFTQPAQSPQGPQSLQGVQVAGAPPGAGHRRTLTGGSNDSLSNVPLAERASIESAKQGEVQSQWMLAQLGFVQPQSAETPRAAGIAPGLTVRDQPAESYASAPPSG